MATTHRRKQTRLQPELYRQEGRIFSITIGTSPRRPIFADLRLGRHCVAVLEEFALADHVPAYAYCLMPDHVHLLLGAVPSYPIPRFVQRWKSKCYQVRRRRGRSEKFWQRGYYDRALRRDEDVRKAAEYILNNPVRTGLVEDWREYPLGGSLVWVME